MGVSSHKTFKFLQPLLQRKGSFLMSIPEPPPKNKGIPITERLIALLQKHPDTDRLVDLICERDAFGRAKYGQPLMSDDGRNGIEDARQELGDLLQYVYKCRLTESRENLDLLMKDIETAFLFIKSIYCSEPQQDNK